MRKLFSAAAVALTLACLALGGVGASTAAASPVHCGLWIGDQAWDPSRPHLINFEIGNCHDYSVRRRVVYTDGVVGSCYTIAAQTTKYLSSMHWPDHIEAC
ncbi:MAG TPA: hypothetical protein VF250_00375 [Conexibacter sp.]